MAKKRTPRSQQPEKNTQANLNRDEPEWTGLILSFPFDEMESPDPGDELGDIDNDDWELRPVNFDPETGKRLKKCSDEEASALERFDIQEDSHHCIWCGTKIAWHYDPHFQWIPCVEALRLNAAPARRKRGAR